MYNNFFLYRKRLRKEYLLLENIYMAGNAFGTNYSNKKAAVRFYNIFTAPFYRPLYSAHDSTKFRAKGTYEAACRCV